MPDSPTPPRSVLVLGAGLAGAQTAATLRALGFDGRLTVLGAEDRAPYDRPPLSKELFARDAPAWLADEIGVDLHALAEDVRLGVAATALEPGPPARVTTADGATLTADVVVVAVGARPVVPPGWDAATLLHSWDDAAALRARLVPGTRLVVVGAGWIGAEVAGTAAAQGCEVTVVEAGTTPLERQLGADVGRHLAPWYARAGVDLRLESPVTALDASSVTLADGSVLGSDVVLAAVGARPATDCLRAVLPADARGSLLADASGRVVPGVYAVGDCVTRQGTAFGDLVGGHWSAALHDPETVARAVLADGGATLPAPPPPTHAPYVFSTQLGHDVAVLGVPSSGHEVVLRGNPAAGGPWSALYLARDDLARDDLARDEPDLARLAAVFVADAHREIPAARRLLREGPVLVDVAVASDPSRPLRDAVRTS